MRGRTRSVALLAALLAVAAPCFAQFHASDLIYMPVVAHLAGANDSLWRSDLFIVNVDDVPIDVALVFVPTGTIDHSALFDDRTAWLGGREEEGFGIVEERLADIPSHGTVVLRDVLGEYYPDEVPVTGSGFMVIFAYEAGTLDAEGGRTYANAVVYNRTYNETKIWVEDPDNEGEFIQQDATYGQLIPGVPWYDTADPAAVTDAVDLTFQLFPAVEQTEDYRFNLGLVNVSDPQTTITVAVELFKGDGEIYTNEEGNEARFVLSLPPLSHIQYNQILLNNFELEEATDILIRVRFVGWTTTSPDPIPAFTAYGSVGDNHSNDATTILPTFASPYDVECMWGAPTEGEAAKVGTRRASRRALDIPSATRSR